MSKRDTRLVRKTIELYLSLLRAEDVNPINHSRTEYLKCTQHNNEHAAFLLSEAQTQIGLGWFNEALLMLGRAEGILLGTCFLSPKQVISLE